MITSHRPCREVRAAHGGGQVRQVGRHVAADARLLKGQRETGPRRFTSLAPSDYLEEQGVIVGRDFGPLLDAGIDANPRPGWQAQEPDPARSRGEGDGIFRVNPGFDGKATGANIEKGRQRFSCGDSQLQADQVEAGDLLGHRVFDLETRIGLQEIGTPTVPEEFGGSKAQMARFAKQGRRLALEFRR